MDRAARELGIEAAPHDLDDIVERQCQPRAQLADERLFYRREADRQVLGRVRAVVDRGTATPAAYGRFADPELGRKFGDGLAAVLYAKADFRCRRGIGV